MNNFATLVIRRETGIDIFRSLNIILDEQKIGEIKDDETLEIPIEPGTRNLYLKMVFSKSNKISFTINPGQNLYFYCHGKYKTYLESMAILKDSVIDRNGIYILKLLDTNSFPKRYSKKFSQKEKTFAVLYFLFIISILIGIMVYASYFYD